MEVAGANRRWRCQFRCRGSRRESAVAQLFSLGILYPMQSRLEPLAIVCKTFATIEAVGAACIIIGLDIFDMINIVENLPPPSRAPLDWGTPAYCHRMYLSIAIVLLIAIFVVIPNRWLVSSRKVFVPSLIIALLPFCLSMLMLTDESVSGILVAPLYQYVGMILLTAPWPISLILSRMRFRRGEAFTYA